MRRAITKTKSGKTVTIALASPGDRGVADDSGCLDYPSSGSRRLKPKFTVTASSVRHSFDAILQHADSKGGRLMAIDRGPWNALIDDDGSNLVGTVWNKDKIKTVLLDPIDRM